MIKQTQQTESHVINISEQQVPIKQQSYQQKIIGRTVIKDKAYYLVKKSNQPLQKAKWIYCKQLTHLKSQISQFRIKKFFHSSNCVQETQSSQLRYELIQRYETSLNDFKAVEKIIGKVKSGVITIYLIKFKNNNLASAKWFVSYFLRSNNKLQKMMIQFNKNIKKQKIPYIDQQYINSCPQYKEIIQKTIRQLQMIKSKLNFKTIDCQNPYNYQVKKEYSFKQINFHTPCYSKYSVKNIIGKAKIYNLNVCLIQCTNNTFKWIPLIILSMIYSVKKILKQFWTKINSKNLPFFIQQFRYRQKQFIQMLNNLKIQEILPIKKINKNNINQILGKRKNNGFIQYLVHFQNNNIIDSVWIKRELLIHKKQAMQKFNELIKNYELPYIDKRYSKAINLDKQIQRNVIQKYQNSQQIENKKSKLKIKKQQKKHLKKCKDQQEVQIKSQIQESQSQDQSQFDFSLSKMTEDVKYQEIYYGQDSQTCQNVTNNFSDKCSSDQQKILCKSSVISIKYKQKVKGKQKFVRQNIYEVKLINKNGKQQIKHMKSSQLMKQYPVDFIQMLQNKIESTQVKEQISDDQSSKQEN